MKLTIYVAYNLVIIQCVYHRYRKVLILIKISNFLFSNVGFVGDCTFPFLSSTYSFRPRVYSSLLSLSIDSTKRKMEHGLIFLQCMTVCGHSSSLLCQFGPVSRFLIPHWALTSWELVTPCHCTDSHPLLTPATPRWSTRQFFTLCLVTSFVIFPFVSLVSLWSAEESLSYYRTWELLWTLSVSSGRANLVKRK